MPVPHRNSPFTSKAVSLTTVLPDVAGSASFTSVMTNFLSAEVIVTCGFGLWATNGSMMMPSAFWTHVTTPAWHGTVSVAENRTVIDSPLRRAYRRGWVVLAVSRPPAAVSVQPPRGDVTVPVVTLNPAGIVRTKRSRAEMTVEVFLTTTL